jgi:hypothetical protein
MAEKAENLKYEGSVPVYLPDRTEVGRATIRHDAHGAYAEVKLYGEAGGALAEQIAGDAISLSIGYQDNTARDAVAFAIEKEQAKEKTDEQ